MCSQKKSGEIYPLSHIEAMSIQMPRKRKGNQPGAHPGSHIEKHDDRTGQDEYQAHTEKVNVGPLQRSDKLFALVDRFLFYILSSVVEKFYTT